MQSTASLCKITALRSGRHGKGMIENLADPATKNAVNALGQRNGSTTGDGDDITGLGLESPDTSVPNSSVPANSAPQSQHHILGLSERGSLNERDSLRLSSLVTDSDGGASEGASSVSMQVDTSPMTSFSPMIDPSSLLRVGRVLVLDSPVSLAGSPQVSSPTDLINSHIFTPFGRTSGMREGNSMHGAVPSNGQLQTSPALDYACEGKGKGSKESNDTEPALAGLSERSENNKFESFNTPNDIQALQALQALQTLKEKTEPDLQTTKDKFSSYSSLIDFVGLCASIASRQERSFPHDRGYPHFVFCFAPVIPFVLRSVFDVSSVVLALLSLPLLFLDTVHLYISWTLSITQALQRYTASQRYTALHSTLPSSLHSTGSTASEEAVEPVPVASAASTADSGDSDGRLTSTGTSPEVRQPAGNPLLAKKSSGVSVDVDDKKRGSRRRLRARAAAVNRWPTQPWKGSNPIKDASFELFCIFYFTVEKFICRIKALTAHQKNSRIRWSRLSTANPVAFLKFLRAELEDVRVNVTQFRRHLGDLPPDFPMSTNDEFFAHDRQGSRCQLSTLVVMDRIDPAEITSGIMQRWVRGEPKMRAIKTRKFRRQFWHVLPEYNSSDSSCDTRVERDSNEASFDVEKHILVKRFDMSQISLAQIMTDLTNEEIPANLPQWMLWVIECYSSDLQQADQEVTSPLRKKTVRSLVKNTYICGKYNHAYADGVGMMTAIVRNLGDEGVSTACLPEKYRRKVVWWQSFFYYLYFTIISFTKTLRYIFYSHYQGRRNASPAAEKRFHATEGGTTEMQTKQQCPRRIYTSASVFDLREIDQLRDHVATLAGGLKPGKEGTISSKRPTANDLFLHCISRAWETVLTTDCLLQMYDFWRHNPTMANRKIDFMPRTNSRHPSTTEHNLSVMIPMMCRTEMPSNMDNFTSLVVARLPKSHPHKLTHSPTHTHNHTPVDEIEGLFETKAVMDDVKREFHPTNFFLIFCAIFKMFSKDTALALQQFAYDGTDFVATNVAAPAIESKFLGKKVQGLFFWPALPSGMLGGTSLVSLGPRLQLLAVVDESLFEPAVQRAYSHFPRMDTGELRRHLTSWLADQIPQLIAIQLNALYADIPA